MKRWLCALGILFATAASASAQEDFPKDSAGNIRVIPFETRTMSDDVFRAGDKTAGAPTEIDGVLGVPLGPGPFPVVELIEGPGGINSNNDYWIENSSRTTSQRS